MVTIYAAVVDESVVWGEGGRKTYPSSAGAEALRVGPYMCQYQAMEPAASEVEATAARLFRPVGPASLAAPELVEAARCKGGKAN